MRRSTDVETELLLRNGGRKERSFRDLKLLPVSSAIFTLYFLKRRTPGNDRGQLPVRTDFFFWKLLEKAWSQSGQN